MGLPVGTVDRRGFVKHVLEFALLLLAVTEIGAASAVGEAGTIAKQIAGNILESDIDYRLPKSVVPMHYEIQLEPNMTDPNPENFTFRGGVKIQLKCKEKTSAITLHASGLNINRSSIEIKTMGGLKIKYNGFEEDTMKEFFTVKLKTTLTPNNQYWINMNYTAPLKNEPEGLYYVKYERNGTIRYMAITKFQPTFARKAFPCFDEPEMKAKFQIDLVKPAKTTSMFGTKIANKDNTFKRGRILYNYDRYKPTHKISTYKLGFVFFDSKAHRKSEKKKPVEIWTYKELARKSEVNVVLGNKLYEHFQKKLVTGKRIKKLHMIAVPWKDCKSSHDYRLILFREAYLLDDNVSESNQALKYRIYTTFARSFAHQFLDLISPLWWDDIWIIEGLASFLEQSAVTVLDKNIYVEDFFIMEKLHTIFALDGGVYTRPLHTPVESPNTIKIMFGGIAVNKGAAIFRMIEFVMGKENFLTALSKLLLKGINFTRENLYNFMEKEAKNECHPLHIKEVFETWVRQTNYPVVMVARDFNRHDYIHVEQQRFLDDETAEHDDKFNAPFNYRWHIPLTFHSRQTYNFTIETSVYWLHKDEYSKAFRIHYPLPAYKHPYSWILANYNQLCYYRVNYPRGNWLALAKQLKHYHYAIPVLNRAQIINDAWSLAKAGYTELESALAVVDYLSEEKHYLPWFTAMKEFKYVMLMIGDTIQGDRFRVFVQKKLNVPFTKFGIPYHENYMVQLMRALIIQEGCNFGIESCNNDTSSLFKAWMSNKDAIPPYLRAAVYCRGIANEKKEQQKHWNFVLKKYSETNDEEEKKHLLFALSCVDNEKYINLLEELILKPDSPFSESSALHLLTLMTKEIGLQARVLLFYYTHHAELTAKFESFNCRYALKQLTQNVNAQIILELVEAIMSDKCKDYDENTYPREIINNIKKNMQWTTKYKPIIGKFLENMK